MPPPARRPAGQPLADRLRPRTLDELVGQDHLLGAETRRSGACSRAASSARSSSGGRPAPARPRSPACSRRRLGQPLVQLSAVMSGVADLRKVYEEARTSRRTGQTHAPVHRRDPPLQSRPAGRAAGPGRGRHRHADRRDHREPLVRAHRRPAVALPGPGAAPPRPAVAGRADRRAPSRRWATACRSMPRPARGSPSSPTAMAAIF